MLAGVFCMGLQFVVVVLLQCGNCRHLLGFAGFVVMGLPLGLVSGFTGFVLGCLFEFSGSGFCCILIF